MLGFLVAFVELLNNVFSSEWISPWINKAEYRNNFKQVFTISKCKIAIFITTVSIT